MEGGVILQQGWRLHFCHVNFRHWLRNIIYWERNTATHNTTCKTPQFKCSKYKCVTIHVREILQVRRIFKSALNENFNFRTSNKILDFKGCDEWSLISLTKGQYQVHPTSLYTRACGLKWTRFEWMKYLHGDPDCMGWIKFRDVPDFVTRPPQKGGFNTKLIDHDTSKISKPYVYYNLLCKKWPLSYIICRPCTACQ